MTTTLTGSERPVSPASTDRPAARRLLPDLESPRQALAYITPNWFAVVMGTGIVAVAAASLPAQFAGMRTAATVVWGVAAALLVGITALTLGHWWTHPRVARGHARNPVMVHFYGAAPMAMLTVGAGGLLVGRDWIGLRAAVDLDWVLWLAGTITGLISAVAVPYLTFTVHQVGRGGAFGGWLMPIVPPMVSASTGALLLPYARPGQDRLSLLLCCYAMFGLSLLASVIVITLIWNRLATDTVGAPRLVPTLWIVLGPLGQSITAANLLGENAHLAIGPRYAPALQAFGVIYGVPVLGFALLWAALASVITVRAVADRLPFSLTWWSFTFPVGTCVTGTTELAVHTGANLFRSLAIVIYIALVLAWLVVISRTAIDTVRGRIFLPPPTEPTPVSA